MSGAAPGAQPDLTEDRLTDSLAPEPRFLYFAYALRDEIPVDEDGLHFASHRCADGRCAPPGARPLCGGVEVRIQSYQRPASGLAEGHEHLNRMLASVRGETSDSNLPAQTATQPDLECRASVLIGGRVMPGEDEKVLYARAHQELQSVIKALKLISRSHAPLFAIERAWPLYYVLRAAGEEPLQVMNLAVVTHTLLGKPPVSPQMMPTVPHLVMAIDAGDPLTLFDDFALGAEAAAETAGNYIDAVLRAATACEVLIKHVSWVLTWEASLADVDPRPGAEVRDHILFRAKPSTLWGGVLVKRIKCNQDSKKPESPLGSWVHHVARTRNKIMHRGYPPGEGDARGAVTATRDLYAYLAECLSAHSNTYPLAKIVMTGGIGLRDPRARQVGEYLTWLDRKLNAAPVE